MPLNVITREGKTVPVHSPLDFEQVLHVRYLPELQFGDERVRMRASEKCQTALAKQWITPRQKWLGAYYAKEAVFLDLTIAWIDDVIGYGVWTNRAIAAATFIGEYTGILRKRAFWNRWKNRYCFDYTVGPKRSTSLVIDCQNCGNHTRFINHSSRPNLDLVSVYFDGMIRVILFANRVIPSGEQLTYDYGEEYWAKRGEPVEIPPGAGVSE